MAVIFSCCVNSLALWWRAMVRLVPPRFGIVAPTIVPDRIALVRAGFREALKGEEREGHRHGALDEPRNICGKGDLQAVNQLAVGSIPTAGAI